MIFKTICGVVIGVIVFTVYCCCIVAGNEDERMGLR